MDYKLLINALIFLLKIENIHRMTKTDKFKNQQIVRRHVHSLDNKCSRRKDIPALKNHIKSWRSKVEPCRSLCYPSLPCNRCSQGLKSIGTSLSHPGSEIQVQRFHITRSLCLSRPFKARIIPSPSE